MYTVVNKLLAKGIIPQVQFDEAYNEARTRHVRIMSLLNVVEDSIRVKPRTFTEFVKILESEPALSILAEKLVEEYIQHQGTL